MRFGSAHAYQSGSKIFNHFIKVNQNKSPTGSHWDESTVDLQRATNPASTG
jgi:hypothetical protein